MNHSALVARHSAAPQPMGGRSGATRGVHSARGLEGLSRPRKQLPPKLFYDRRGAELFTAICSTRAYYPTRTENGILDRRAGEIAGQIGSGSAVIEFGAGEIQKMRRVAAEPAARRPMRRSISRASSWCWPRAEPGAGLSVAVGHRGHRRLPDSELESELTLPADARRVVFFPGSTIGNFEPEQATGIPARAFARWLADAGGVLIGVDLRKPVRRLDLAYNDPEGYTAAFNLNLLARLNRELGADFDLAAIRARSVLQRSARSRIEMHLRSLRAQRVRIGSRVFAFAAGETIHTENSYKYTPRRLRRNGAHRRLPSQPPVDRSRASVRGVLPV